jgi:hypothetical protein
LIVDRRLLIIESVAKQTKKGNIIVACGEDYGIKQIIKPMAMAMMMMMKMMMMVDGRCVSPVAYVLVRFANLY